METLGQTRRKQTRLFMFNIGHQENNLVRDEANGVDEISNEEYSTEPHRKMFQTAFRNQQEKRDFFHISV